jgi:hypothetical protein
VKISAHKTIWNQKKCLRNFPELFVNRANSICVGGISAGVCLAKIRPLHNLKPIFLSYGEEKERSCETGVAVGIQGCRIFLSAIYQNGGNGPNSHKIYQMAIKYIKCRKIHQMSKQYSNILHCKTLQNLPKLRWFLVWKLTIWQPWLYRNETNEKNCRFEWNLKSLPIKDSTMLIKQLYYQYIHYIIF